MFRCSEKTPFMRLSPALLDKPWADAARANPSLPMFSAEVLEAGADRHGVSVFLG